MQGQYTTIDKPIEDNLTYFVSRVFSTEDGKRLLEELKEHFLLQPVATLGINEHYPYYREGQNDIIRMFIKATEVKQ